MIYPSLETFKKLSKEGNLIPVYKEIPADLETPVSAYLKTQSEHSFLLESVEGGENLARYSFIGHNPHIIFKAKGEKISIQDGDNISECSGDPITKLKEIMSQFNPIVIPELPRFHGGAVGYFSYDSIRYIEDIPNSNADKLKTPDVFFVIADTILAFDHVKHKIIIISNAIVKDDVELSYNNAVSNINSFLEQLNKPLDPELFQLNTEINGSKDDYASNFTLEQFSQIVNKAKKYIYDGDIFQVVLSQRFSKKTKLAPFEIYRKLRMINPSPYMFYLNFGKTKLIGSSPEILVRLEGEKATLRPIAGTRPRGKTVEEDRELEKDLLADEKEKSEHIMLVDLGRNDLGRCCKYSTVKTTDLMTIERYSHVMHIVSNVEGTIKDNLGGLDLYKSCFPAGTLSGAPKVRAMEIIDELENVQRGPYGGAIGYFDFAGNMDTGIIIRTILMQDDTVHIQAGAGIVADSNPEMEYQETINKAKALLSIC